MVVATSPDFQEALRAGDFPAARRIATDASDLSLEDALALTVLAAEAAPELYAPMARRWLARLVVERTPRPAELQAAARLLARLDEGSISAAEVNVAMKPITKPESARAVSLPNRAFLALAGALALVAAPAVAGPFASTL